MRGIDNSREVWERGVERRGKEKKDRKKGSDETYGQ